MKKLFFGLTLLILIIIGGAYTLAFTPMGNGIVASMIEDKANEQPNVNFKVEKFVLTTSDISFHANVDNNSYIKVEGKLALLSKEFDLSYDVNVKDLAKLKKLTNADLRGNFITKGTVKGDAKLLNVNGASDIFASATTYSAKLVDFEPSDIIFNVKNAQIDKLLYTVNQPIYATGKINIDGNLKNMAGQIKTTIAKGKVNNPVVNKAFNQKLVKPLMFKGNIVTDLTKQQAVSKVDFFTTMANVFVKKAVVNLDDASINSDYLVKVDDMSKLYDVAQMKMRGKIALNGTIEKAKELTVTGVSKLLGGALNFKLHNDDFSSTIKDVQLVKVLHMLYYPEVFTSSTDLAVKYNLLAQKGTLTGDLINGHFLPNEYSTLLKTVAQFDLTKEVYETVKINSDINKEIIKSTVDMKSKLTEIKVPYSTLDTKKQTIDALVKTNLKGIEFDTKITGKTANPTIKMDTSKLVKAAAVKKVKEKAKKKIEEAIGDKLGDKAGGLLKGLFQ